MSSMLTLEREIPFDACRVLSAANMPSYVERPCTCILRNSYDRLGCVLHLEDPEVAAEVLIDWDLVRALSNITDILTKSR